MKLFIAVTPVILWFLIIIDCAGLFDAVFPEGLQPSSFGQETVQTSMDPDVEEKGNRKSTEPRKGGSSL